MPKRLKPERHHKTTQTTTASKEQLCFDLLNCTIQMKGKLELSMVLHPSRHIAGHLGDDLPSQSHAESYKSSLTNCEDIIPLRSSRLLHWLSLISITHTNKAAHNIECMYKVWTTAQCWDFHQTSQQRSLHSYWHQKPVGQSPVVRTGVSIKFREISSISVSSRSGRHPAWLIHMQPSQQIANQQQHNNLNNQAR